MLLSEQSAFLPYNTVIKEFWLLTLRTILVSDDDDDDLIFNVNRILQYYHYKNLKKETQRRRW